MASMGAETRPRLSSAAERQRRLRAELRRALSQETLAARLHRDRQESKSCKVVHQDELAYEGSGQVVEDVGQLCSETEAEAERLSAELQDLRRRLRPEDELASLRDEVALSRQLIDRQPQDRSTLPHRLLLLRLLLLLLIGCCCY
ncbi:unnamed protein product [Polarella glacialis]|uniref:Uncharacterized protein n=1 Tax=Polarella glacialis TaxID=89957 RepID=A0A813K724_POLGL|nr:unnamed protein product [Polarella glacialis]CAE8694222.1 unnamed protein product [Polarella glacialis]